MSATDPATEWRGVLSGEWFKAQFCCAWCAEIGIGLRVRPGVPGEAGEARPLPATPGRNSLAATENLNAELLALRVRASGFGEDQGDRDGDREPAPRGVPGASMPDPRRDDDRERDGREPGVTEPWFGRGGTGFPDGCRSSRCR